VPRSAFVAATGGTVLTYEFGLVSYHNTAKKLTEDQLRVAKPIEHVSPSTNHDTPSAHNAPLSSQNIANDARNTLVLENEELKMAKATQPTIATPQERQIRLRTSFSGVADPADTVNRKKRRGKYEKQRRRRRNMHALTRRSVIRKQRDPECEHARQIAGVLSCQSYPRYVDRNHAIVNNTPTNTSRVRIGSSR
jgi:hypothetical protein